MRNKVILSCLAVGATGWACNGRIDVGTNALQEGGSPSNPYAAGSSTQVAMAASTATSTAAGAITGETIDPYGTTGTCTAMATGYDCGTGTGSGIGTSTADGSFIQGSTDTGSVTGTSTLTFTGTCDLLGTWETISGPWNGQSTDSYVTFNADGTLTGVIYPDGGTTPVVAYTGTYTAGGGQLIIISTMGENMNCAYPDSWTVPALSDCSIVPLDPQGSGCTGARKYLDWAVTLRQVQAPQLPPDSGLADTTSPIDASDSTDASSPSGSSPCGVLGTWYVSTDSGASSIITFSGSDEASTDGTLTGFIQATAGVSLWTQAFTGTFYQTLDQIYVLSTEGELMNCSAPDIWTVSTDADPGSSGFCTSLLTVPTLSFGTQGEPGHACAGSRKYLEGNLTFFPPPAVAPGFVLPGDAASP